MTFLGGAVAPDPVFPVAICCKARWTFIIVKEASHFYSFFHCSCFIVFALIFIVDCIACYSHFVVAPGIDYIVALSPHRPQHCKARDSLVHVCGDVPLRNYSLDHSLTHLTSNWNVTALAVFLEYVDVLSITCQRERWMSSL